MRANPPLFLATAENLLIYREYAKINPMDNVKVIATNRKAKHEYFLLETFEAGISLQGSEIKSIRAGQISIKEAYVRVDGEEAWLVNAHIAPYDPASRENHDPRRERKLLLHKKEIANLWDEVRQKGVTVIPIRVYLKRGKAKVEISIVKGKKHFDKRQAIAKRDAQREIDRSLKKKY
jgi:SsrA-binding protein